MMYKHYLLRDNTFRPFELALPVEPLKSGADMLITARVLRHRKKRPGVDFFFKAISAGLTNLPNQESRD